MAYDRELADRVREHLAATPGVSEKAMFGGLSFLIDGNLAVAVHAKGGLLVRVGADAIDDLVSDGVEHAVMGSRRMSGWVHVDADVVTTDSALRRWVDRGVAYARTLPSK